MGQFHACPRICTEWASMLSFFDAEKASCSSMQGSGISQYILMKRGKGSTIQQPLSLLAYKLILVLLKLVGIEFPAQRIVPSSYPPIERGSRSRSRFENN